MTLFVRDVRGAHPPVVLLLHEGAGSGTAWDRFLPRLLAGNVGLLYHRRGYRYSPRDAWLAADHFNQPRDLLDRQGTGLAHVLGHSDGESIALLEREAARRSPVRVRQERSASQRRTGAISAARRAFSLTSHIAQRDGGAGIRRAGQPHTPLPGN